MKISFNSPLILNLTFTSFIILVLDSTILPGLIEFLFVVGPAGSFQWTDPIDYVRLVSHGLGHGDFAHFFGNFSLILLIGPYLEEKFGTRNLLGMILITLFATGVFNVLFFPNGLLGASGIVFMFILLGSFAGAQPGTIPATFILVVLLYLGNEVLSLFGPEDGISQTAHLLGGLSGSVFGFLSLNRRKS